MGIIRRISRLFGRRRYSTTASARSPGLIPKSPRPGPSSSSLSATSPRSSQVNSSNNPPSQDANSDGGCRPSTSGAVTAKPPTPKSIGSHSKLKDVVVETTGRLLGTPTSRDSDGLVMSSPEGAQDSPTTRTRITPSPVAHPALFGYDSEFPDTVQAGPAIVVKCPTPNMLLSPSESSRACSPSASCKEEVDLNLDATSTSDVEPTNEDANSISPVPIPVEVQVTVSTAPLGPSPTAKKAPEDEIEFDSSKDVLL